jgi:hypothetical protein
MIDSWSIKTVLSAASVSHPRVSPLRLEAPPHVPEGATVPDVEAPGPPAPTTRRLPARRGWRAACQAASWASWTGARLGGAFQWRGVGDRVSTRRRWKRPLDFPILSQGPSAPAVWSPLCSTSSVSLNPFATRGSTGTTCKWPWRLVSTLSRSWIRRFRYKKTPSCVSVVHARRGRVSPRVVSLPVRHACAVGFLLARARRPESSHCWPSR